MNNKATISRYAKRRASLLVGIIFPVCIMIPITFASAIISTLSNSSIVSSIIGHIFPYLVIFIFLVAYCFIATRIEIAYDATSGVFKKRITCMGKTVFKRKTISVKNIRIEMQEQMDNSSEGGGKPTITMKIILETDDGEVCGFSRLESMLYSLIQFPTCK